MAHLSLKNIRKSYGGDLEVIKGIDLEIEDREFVVFVGPSGCGKSTLLRMIAGLEEITDGDLFIDGERVNGVPASKRGLAMVFQSYALYPHMSVRDNMGFALRLAGVDKAERAKTVEGAAKVLQLDHLLDRKPRELSGGQRQRVAIGRSIVRQPKVFLFDEPLSNLDAALRVQMRIELAGLHERLNATMIYVTHDQIEAMTMADKIVVLQGGVVAQAGSPLELYHHPENRFVAGFIGSPKMNFLPVTVRNVGDAGVEVDLPGGATLSVPVAADGLAPGAEIELGVRPEHLRPVAPEHGSGLAAEVLVAERLGGETYLYTKQEGLNEMLVVKADGENPVREHERIAVAPSAEHCHLFHPDGRALPHLHRHPLADLSDAA